MIQASHDPSVLLPCIDFTRSSVLEMGDQGALPHWLQLDGSWSDTGLWVKHFGGNCQPDLMPAILLG